MSSILNVNPLLFNQYQQQSNLGIPTLTLPKNPFEDLQRERQQDINLTGEVKLLRLSPEKGNAESSVQSRLDQMTNAFLQKENFNLNNQANTGLTQVKGPQRISNQNFMSELHKVYYNKETENKKELSQRKTGHGTNPIEFRLFEAIVEEKLQNVTEQAMKKTSQDIHSQLNTRTKNLREYLDSQLQRSQLAIKNLQTDIKEQEKSYRNQDLRDPHDDSFFRQSQFHLQPSNQLMSSQNEDFKTKALKKALVEDAKYSYLSNKLQCKPIEGHDLPLSDLQQSTYKLREEITGKRGQLLEVQNIETLENEIKDENEILKMLMPGQLKQNTMEFLEVDDIQSIKDVKGPKTQAQKDRETYQKALEEDKFEINVSDEERHKTMKCLMKVLDYQLKSIQDQAKDLDEHYKKADKDIKEYEKFLDKEESKRVMEEIRKKIKKASDMAEDGLNDRQFDEADEVVGVTDLIVENKILIDQIDAMMGNEMTSSAPMQKLIAEEEEAERNMSDSFVDRLYREVTRKTQKKKEKSGNQKKMLPVVMGKVIHKRKTPQKSVKVEVYVPKGEKRELDERQKKIKEERKKEMKEKIERIEKSMSPRRGKSKGGMKKVDDKLNREINDAMKKMDKMVKFAFDDQF